MWFPHRFSISGQKVTAKGPPDGHGLPRLVNGLAPQLLDFLAWNFFSGNLYAYTHMCQHVLLSCDQLIFKKTVLLARALEVLLHSASIQKWLFGFYMHLHPLNQFRNPPKFHRLFRMVVSPVGAFYSIKFGQLGGKIEVGRQHILIAIYA